MIPALLMSVDRAARREHVVGEHADGIQVGQIELGDLDAIDSVQQLTRGVRPSRRHHDRRAALAHSSHVFKPNA
jgi:hypothetical protein